MKEGSLLPEVKTTQDGTDAKSNDVYIYNSIYSNISL